MGMKKQFRISFDVTTTLSNEQEDMFTEYLKELATTPRNPRQDHLLVQALTYGTEGALEALMCGGLREAIRDLQQELKCREFTTRFSPATVRLKP